MLRWGGQSCMQQEGVRFPKGHQGENTPLELQASQLSSSTRITSARWIWRAEDRTNHLLHSVKRGRVATAAV